MSNKIIKRLWKYLIENFHFFTQFENKRNSKKFPIKILNSDYRVELPTVHFIHRFITNNSGDKACGYYQYFLNEFKDHKCIVHDINYVHYYLINKNDIAIIGGGGLINNLDTWNKTINSVSKVAGKSVIWSAGFNSHIGDNLTQIINWERIKLISIRDYSHYSKFRYVPCGSCMISSLNNEYKVIREIGMVLHPNQIKLPEELIVYDKISNDDPLQLIIEFIGSSNIILTDSYHAAYWSILMQRKCILLNGSPEKFNHFKYMPSVYSGDLYTDISKAKIYPQSLKEAKDLTLGYVRDIVSLLE